VAWSGWFTLRRRAAPPIPASARPASTEAALDAAYVTTLTGGDAYLPGIEALGQSLRETGTTAPLVCMVTPDVPSSARERLVDQGWRVRPVDPIPNPHPDVELLYPRFAMTFAKLRAFELVEHDKVVLLDADTIVLRNVDDLFARPSIAAASDFFLPDRFNSGVLVLEPSVDLFARLLTRLHAAESYDGGDQGFLNTFWPDWWAMPVGHRLPSVYNVHHFVFQFMVSHPVVGDRFAEETRIVHFTLQKPWRSFTVTGGSAVWWEKLGHLHPGLDKAWRRRLHALQDRVFEAFVHAVGG
jgi:alpha-N-acetylglucosamine transferase